MLGSNSETIDPISVMIIFIPDICCMKGSWKPKNKAFKETFSLISGSGVETNSLYFDIRSFFKADFFDFVVIIISFKALSTDFSMLNIAKIFLAS